MKIQENYNLTPLNTFGIKAEAKFFAEIKSETDLLKLFSSSEFNQSKRIFIGGGSNVLFTGDFDGIVVLNKLKGIEIEKENSENVFIRAMGGEIWHDFVMFSVNRGYWGVENLALVPGTVGAAPIQNIGAYGAELNDVLDRVEAYEVVTGKKRVFNRKECRLGYRDSIFKNELRNKYFISGVIFKLSKIEKKNISYRTLKEYLGKNKIKIRSSKDIAKIVMAIRKSKLPDPKMLGNAGSFFKNIFITKEQLQKLQSVYPEISYFEEDGIIKIPAGWLIEQCGWKGRRLGGVGVHEKQALVLVNYGGATGGEVLDLADKIILSVKEKFGLELEPEVNIV